MTELTICYVLAAIGLCTIHLCLGVWIGTAVESNRQAAMPKFSPTATEYRSKVADMAVLVRHAREIREACSSLPQLPHRLVVSIEALDKTVASLMTDMRQKRPTRSVRATLAPVVLSKPNGAILVSSGSASQATSRHESLQFIAPCEGDGMPSSERFEQVRCLDLTSAGCAYFSKEVPDYDTLVVALGSHPDLMFVAAEVTHSWPVSLGGEVGHSISCRFLRKLSNVYQWNAEMGRIVSIPSIEEEILRASSS